MDEEPLTEFTDDMTLAEARELLRGMVAEGATCPVCRQKAKVYRRKINSTMARSLIVAARHSSDGAFFHAPSLPGDTHEFSQLSWWGLVVEESTARPDGGRSGWWCLTPAGRRFVHGGHVVWKYVNIYDGRVLSNDGSLVTIRDCLGSKFNYEELMRGV